MSESKPDQASESPPEAKPTSADKKERSLGGNILFALAFVATLIGGYYAGQWAIDYFRPVELDEGERVKVDLRGDEPQIGSDAALVTVVEFSDFQCPFCGKGAPEIEAAIADFDDDEVRLVFKHYPLPMHSLAPAAARAAWAAHQQDKFWPFAEWLFEVKGDFKDFPAKVKELGMDEAKFVADMESDASRDAVDSDMLAGGRAGVSGTPAFLINGHFYSGARPASFWKKAIKAELKYAEQVMDDEGLEPGQVYAHIMSTALDKRGDGNPVGGKPSDRKQARPGQPNPMLTYAVPTDGRAQKGPDDALVTIVEFADFHCPFCSKVNPTLRQLLKKYEGDVRVVFRHYPLPIHPEAGKASKAVLAAEKQGAFWSAFDTAFELRAKTEDDFREIAKRANIDADKLIADMQDPALQTMIDEDTAVARRFGVTGTPAFFINGRFLSGAQPIENFETLIDSELEKAKKRLATGVPREGIYDAIVEEGLAEVSK